MVDSTLPGARLLCLVLGTRRSGNKLFLAVTMFGTTFFNRWNWQKLFSYGEVVCFVSAWAVGLLVAMQSQRPNSDRPIARTFAAAGDALGIQATLLR